MTALLRRLRSDDSGLGIVEVVVAMVLFALIVTGSMYTMLQVLQTTRDSRAQQVAANLAAQDIDLARDYDDLFKLLPTTYTVPLNGDTFTVTRQTEWVNGSGNDVQCGSGGAALSYKRVNVVVTWDNMRNSNPGVRADTVVDPKSRITDPTKGTILVFVRTDGGVGSPGVTVKAAPSATANGAVTPSPSTVTTDASGCAYILKVQPGNYDISLSHTSNKYVDEKQNAAPVKILGVQANATASVGFQYDAGGTVTAQYASNYIPTPRPIVPSNMLTTFVNTYGSVKLPRQASDQFLLHPFTSGYQTLAGDEDACKANDPQEWTAFGATPVAPATEPAGVKAGLPSPAPVPMGVIRVTGASSGGKKYLRAVSYNSTSAGTPGCATEQVLRWTGEIVPNNSGTVDVALPFGYWRLYVDDKSNSNSGTLVGTGGTSLTQLTNAGDKSLLASISGLINVDPRVK